MQNVSDISFPKLQCLALKLYYFTGKEKIRLTQNKTNVPLPSMLIIIELS